ncbi:hypothetical protein JI664_19185 [Rhodobacter sp. NTK016B]|uniref:hypothetical protein n=1 Tax=Rhodobacter sp. NTK016B TaxID=2759676 RepID=UPI001A909146|nr:hypothetical protein [Rhodobacter sp. NTK016B]MBN8294103.1 hypothetical protein [Rhodobacter sp. NTK016B]
MEFMSNLLLAAATLGAAAYCVVLSRRLKALASLEGGMGSAIALLSTQVDDLSHSLDAAREASSKTRSRLDAQTTRAEAVARKLELLVASMHDLPEDPPRDPGSNAVARHPAAATPPQTAALRSARPPSPWPASAGRRAPLGEPDEGQDDDAPLKAPARARVLRRRQTAQAAESR